MKGPRDVARAIAAAAPPKRGGSANTPVAPPGPVIVGRGVIDTVVGDGTLTVFFNGSSTASPCSALASFTPTVGMVVEILAYDNVLRALGPLAT
jgi:hypothetical protein